MQTACGPAPTGIYVKYGDSFLIADSGTLNEQTGEVEADGHVRIESGDQIWVGEHIRYNFKTHQMQSEEFRTGKPPVFAAGRELEGNTTNRTYDARHLFITTDDISNPATRVRASRVRIVPGKYIEMWNAVLYVDGVPTFYFPYYKRNLGERANNFNFVPGDRTAYGPYLLNTYTWFLGDHTDGQIHLDYYETPRRGGGAGFALAAWSLGRLRSSSIITFTTMIPAPASARTALTTWDQSPKTGSVLILPGRRPRSPI